MLLFKILYYLRYGRKICILFAFSFCLDISLSAFAQTAITPDSTLTSPTQVNINGNIHNITGGERPGNATNLFHSLSQFSLGSGDTARFVHDGGIQNIITRITGGSVSNINGTIQTWIDGVESSNANLFLINPQGIIFGANATLDIGGAFVASTADSIKFADGSVFSAVNPTNNPILTISVPIGLQLGSNPNSTIEVNGSGNNITSNSNFSINTNNRPSGLHYTTPNNQTLALVGGNVKLDGGNVTVPEGRVELWSIANGEVTFQNQENGQIQLEPGTEINYGNIDLINAASVSTSGNSAGTIKVRGQNVSLKDGSAIVTDTLGDGLPGELNVWASDLLLVQGIVNTQNNQIFSGLLADVGTGATGLGSNITITANRLEVTDGAQISSGTFGVGNAGILNVTTNEIFLNGTSPFGPSGLFAPVAVGATGNGGTININTNSLQTHNSAVITTNTFGTGNAGELNISAQDIQLQTSSGLFASTSVGSAGDGGNINIITDSLTARDSASITTTTNGQGDVGDVSIKANDIYFSNLSGLFATVNPGATGDGGKVTIETNNLLVTDGARIETATNDIGNAGELQIQAENMEVTGFSNFVFGNQTFQVLSRVSTAVVARSGIPETGTGGKLSINAGTLRVKDGGQLGSNTTSTGAAGDVEITANLVELSGVSESGRSGLFASTFTGNGDGGNIKLTTNELQIKDGATISVSNFQSQNLAPPGTGAAGNLEINSPKIILTNNGLITADTNAGDQGNITINSQNLQMLQGSRISTNARNSADGGNITISTDTLVALDNSDITANAQAGLGGRVRIIAQGIFGTEFRPELTPESDITASSELGAEFSGIVEITTPDVDPSRGLVKLPNTPIDPRQGIIASCGTGKENDNNLIITGRGGLPTNPTHTLRGQTVWQDMRNMKVVANDATTTNFQVNQHPEILVEAQGLIIDENGNAHLVAQMPKVNSATSWQATTNCARTMVKQTSN